MVTFTQSEIDTFRQTLLDRRGAISFTRGDEQTTFASYEEAVKFLAFMERNITTGATGGIRYAATSKGV
jgi:hypothetical protein